MIINAEIINQPYAGLYEERIFDIPSPWNSQNWTWVKFLNNDYIEWCGEFRGEPKGIAFSTKYNTVLILTSDYLYQINCISSDLIDYISEPQYHQLTVMPSGDFLLADYYTIYILKASLEEIVFVESPIGMDNIKFNNWNNDKLIISCDEFINWDNHIELAFNSTTYELTVNKSK